MTRYEMQMLENAGIKIPDWLSKKINKLPQKEGEFFCPYCKTPYYILEYNPTIFNLFKLDIICKGCHGIFGVERLDLDEPLQILSYTDQALDSCS